MKFEDLLDSKKVSGLVLELGSIVDFKVNKVTGTKQIGEDYWDVPGVELTGKWDDYKIKSDCLFSQADVDDFEHTVTLLP